MAQQHTSACHQFADSKRSSKAVLGHPKKHGSTGISVSTSGVAGDLGVYGFALTGEREQPAHTALNFNDPGLVRSSNTVFTGVPVGHADLLPTDTFVPQIAIVNFGSQPATAQVLYSTTNESGPAPSTVATVSLAPQSSKSIALSALTGDSQMRNSFIVQSNAPAGSLVANLVASGNSQFGAVQLVGKDQMQVPNSGAHPWTIADRMTSTLLLFNHSNAQQSFDVNISAGGIFWQQQYKLAALETKSLSLNDLIATGAKDQKGKVLPKDAKEGEVGWSVEKGSNGTGRLLVSRSDLSLARSFSCSTQDVPCGLEFAAYALDLAIGGIGALGPVTTDYCTTCFPSCGECTGTYDYSGGGDSVSWNSYDTSIASVDDSGDVTAQSPGQTTIQATGDDPACMVQSGNATVSNPPDHLWVNNDKSGQNNCSGSNVGWRRDINYLIKDSAGNNIESPIGIEESFTSKSNNGVNVCINQQVTTAETCTGSNSQGSQYGNSFTDTLATGCGAATSSTCYTFTGQVWNWCYLAGGFGGPSTPAPIGKTGDIVATQTSVTLAGSTFYPQAYTFGH